MYTNASRTSKVLTTTPEHKHHIQNTFIMSGTEETFHFTKEDVRRMEQKESAAHGGSIPADSATAALQVRINRHPFSYPAVSPIHMSIYTAQPKLTQTPPVRRRPSRQEQSRHHRRTQIQPAPARPAPRRLGLELGRRLDRQRRLRPRRRHELLKGQRRPARARHRRLGRARRRKRDWHKHSGPGCRPRGQRRPRWYPQ